MARVERHVASRLKRPEESRLKASWNQSTILRDLVLAPPSLAQTFLQLASPSCSAPRSFSDLGKLMRIFTKQHERSPRVGGELNTEREG